MEVNNDIENQQTSFIIHKPCSPVKSPTIYSDNSISDDNSINNGNECPICLDEKNNFDYLLCGHKICSECIIELENKDCLNKCPICRYPLNWIGYVLYNGNEFVLRNDTPDTIRNSIRDIIQNNNSNINSLHNIIIETGIADLILERDNYSDNNTDIEININQNIQITTRNNNNRNNNNRNNNNRNNNNRNNIYAERDKECVGNVLCAILVTSFLIFFAFSAA